MRSATRVFEEPYRGIAFIWNTKKIFFNEKILDALQIVSLKGEMEDKNKVSDEELSNMLETIESLESRESELESKLGTIICEDLTKDNCSFAISSYGKRCVLEDYEGKKGMVEYQCRTSEVMVEIMSDYIETDECVRACGVNRNATGISSDALLDKNSIVTLCSPPCYQRCPNIVDLHFNLAVGEGSHFPQFNLDRHICDL
ncbi:putative PAR1 protein [Tanacetum coccineum]